MHKKQRERREILWVARVEGEYKWNNRNDSIHALYIRVFNFIIFSLTWKQAEASLFRKGWCKRAQITYIILFTRCGTSLEFTCHQISIIKLRRHVLLNLSFGRSARPDSIANRDGSEKWLERGNWEFQRHEPRAPRTTRNRNCPWSASSIKLHFPETKRQRRREELRSSNGSPSVGMRYEAPSDRSSPTTCHC